MSERTKGQVRVIALVVVGIVIQTTLGADLRVRGVAPDLMLLLAICAGLFGGSHQGVLVGFACGLLSDLFLTNTPFGLAALTFCLVGYVVGALRVTLLPDGWGMVPVMAFVGTVLGVVAFVGIGDLVGQSQLVDGSRMLVRTVVIEALANTVLSLPVAWLYEHGARGTEGAAEVARGSTQSALG
jgi:rod shape-determining protein MreD